jgi:DNA-binding helix-hairpin-helix protein with protein kinase domain
VKELPEPGDTLFMERTGEPLRVGERVGEGGQGVVHRVLMRTGAPLAVKWYRQSTDTPAQRAAIKQLAGRRCPHDAFLFPLDTVTSEGTAGFGYVMPWLDARFATFAHVINDQRPPGLQTKAKIGRKLAEAFGALHASGLCYRDINFSNLWVDPLRGDVAIIDNDNVGLDDGHAAVWGVPRFMAPEVIRREHKPSTITDLHSLAVLLFYLFMHGHPLEGTRLEAAYTWSEGRRKPDAQLAVEHYGTTPVFVFDPANHSNPAVEGHGPATWWPIYPEFLHRLFTQAFTIGLTEATLSARVLASTWRDALLQVSDLCQVCPTCAAALVHDPENPRKACWSCGNVPAAVAQLRLRSPRRTLLTAAGHPVLLIPGAMLCSHHVMNDRDYDTSVAQIETHPRAGLVLRNRSAVTWTAHPEDDGPRLVAPGQAFALRTAMIDFGATRGDIVMPEA